MPRSVNLGARIALIGIVVALVGAGGANAADNLAAQWHMDTATDTSPDSSGNGNTLGLIGGVQLVPGRFGSGLDFNGISTKAFAGPSGTLEPPHFTLLAWVKHSGTQLAYRTVIAGGGIDCNAAPWALYTGENGGITFYIWDGAVARTTPNASPAQVWDGSWHAVAGTYDGATVRLYVDGQQVGGGTPAPNPIVRGGEHRLQFADYTTCGSPNFIAPVSMDEVRVYDRALEADEIQRLQTWPGSDPPPALVPPAAGPPTAPPQASFVSSIAKPKAGKLVTFDASSTTSGAAIEKYVWDLNGDGKTDGDCDGANPKLQTSFAKPGSAKVTLTAIDVLGQSSAASLAISIAGKPSQTVGKKAPETVVRCFGDSLLDLTGAGGPPPGCTDQVQVRITEAIGCLEPVADRGKLPGPERRILDGTIGSDLGLGGAGASSAHTVARPAENVLQEIAGSLTGRLYVSHQTVRINGIDYQPRGGAAIVIAEAPLFSAALAGNISHSYLISSNATTALGDVQLTRGQVKTVIDLKEARIAAITLPKSVPLLPAMPIGGRLTVDLVRYAARIGANLGLPAVFRDPTTGKGITVATTLKTANRQGLALDGLHVAIPYASLAGVGVENLTVNYSAATKRLDGSVRVSFPPGGNAVLGQIGFLNGGFERLYLQYQAGVGQGINVGPGIYLTKIGGGFRVDPTELRADVTVGAGAAVASGCPVFGVTGNLLLHFSPDPVVVRADGSGTLLCIPIVGTYLEVTSGGYAQIGGRLDYDVAPFFSLNANVNAAFLYPHFTSSGRASACIFDKSLCTGGDALVSDRGAAFCATLLDFDPPVGPRIRVRGGIGFDWPPPAALTNAFATTAFVIGHLDVMAVSCDVGGWRTVTAGASASAAGGAQSVQVGADQRALVLQIAGAGEAPKVTVRGPDGTVVDVPDTGALRAGRSFAVRTVSDHAAYVMIAAPKAGRWTIEPKDGSAAIASVRTAEALPPPHVTAKVVRGLAGRRVLRYRVRPIAGQRVSFLERTAHGARRIGIGKRRAGQISFRPSTGPGASRKRTVVAVVEQGGRPRATLEVAHFQAPSRELLSRPRSLVVHRARGRLVMSWHPVPGAHGYLVSVTLSDGRRALSRVKGTRARTAKVARDVRGSLRVAAIASAGRPGPAAKAKVRAARRRGQHPTS